MDLPDLSELYNQFEIPDFKEWEQSIRKGLKSESQLPFASEHSSTHLSLGPFSTETGAILRGDTDMNKLNKELLFLLSQGIQAMQISFTSKLNAQKLATLLTNVIVDYIHVFWNVDADEKIVIENYWKTQNLDTTRHTFINNGNYFNNETELAHATIAKQLVDDILYISVNIGTDYIKEVAKLRAIHTIVEQKKISNYHLIAKFNPSSNLDKDTRKIANTTMAMAAMIGGCTYAFPFNYHEDADEVRIASNAIQILKFESKVDTYSDPLAGSYMIEELTTAYLAQAKTEV